VVLMRPPDPPQKTAAGGWGGVHYRQSFSDEEFDPKSPEDVQRVSRVAGGATERAPRTRRGLPAHRT